MDAPMCGRPMQSAALNYSLRVAPRHVRRCSPSMHGVHIWNGAITRAHNAKDERPVAVQPGRAEELSPRPTTFMEPA